jgi:hypothetical protein
MGLITALNHHVVAADSTLAVEQGGNEYPVPVAFDFLEELYAGNLWHWRSLGLTATIFAYKGQRSNQLNYDPLARIPRRGIALPGAPSSSPK